MLTTRWLLVSVVALPIALAAAAPSAHADHTGELVFRGEAGGGVITIVTTQDRDAVLRATVEDVLFPAGPEATPTPPFGGPCDATTITDTAHILDPPVPITDGDVNVTLLFISGVPAFSTIGIESTFSDANTIQGTIGALQQVPGEGFCTSGEVPFTATGPIETPPAPDDLFFAGGIADWGAELTTSARPDASGVTSLTVQGIDSPCSYGRNLISHEELIDGSLFFEPPLAFQESGEFETVMFLAWSGQVFDLERYTFTGRVLADHAEGTVRVDGIYFNAHTFCTREASWSAVLVSAPATPTLAPPTATPASTTQPVALPGAGARDEEAPVPVVLLLMLTVAGLAAGVVGYVRLR